MNSTTNKDRLSKNKYAIFYYKRYVEQVLMYPFVLLGKLIAILNPLKTEYDIFFFFPGYEIGGAERVNAEIIEAVKDKRVIIFFTKKSANDGMKHFFQLPHVTFKEINKWTDNKWIYWASFIYRGTCSRYINSQKKAPVVFIGQCNFGYKLTPHIKRAIKILELIHMHDPRFTWVWAPFVQFINKRIIIADVFKKQFGECYSRFGIPEKYLDRLYKISNCLEYIPAVLTEKNFNLPLKIYYAGRGGPQKRVWLIVKIIEKCRQLNLDVQFKLAGSFKNEMPAKLIDDGTYIGELKGGEAIYQFHKDNDILLMTSAFEGFPIVIMEAMAFGAIPFVVNVDAIPEHVKDGYNGFLINEVSNEVLLVDEAVTKLAEIISKRSQLPTLSKNGHDYACKNFTKEKFIAEYRKVMFE
jgi:L-malate glycosyltransferase